MKNKSDISQLQKTLGVSFKDTALLKKALVHRSYVNENKSQNVKNNERLEFLGDAVLELLVTIFLFENFPERSEGDLTSFRSALVKTTSLSQTSTKLNLGKYLFLSKGEETTGGRKRPYILANTFEAVLGAIYLDQGIDTANKFLQKHLFPKIKEIVEKRLDIDNKSKLQELSQEATNITPVYELLLQKGPDHRKEFQMGVKIGKELFGKGSGKNKQEAEQKAAEDALKNWNELSKIHFPEKQSI